MRRCRFVLLNALFTAFIPAPFAGVAEAGDGRTEPIAGLVVGIILLVPLALLAVIVVGGGLCHLGARREDEADWLEERITDAVNEALGTVPIVVLAEPGTRRAPTVIELSGTLPSWELREAVLGVVAGETTRIGRDVRIEDRLEVEELSRRTA